MGEDVLPVPEDPYGIAKLAVEQELRVTHEMFGLDYVIFRPHNVYGEHQNIDDRYRNVVGIFMNQILHGKPMTIFGDGSQVRAFTHISDVAPMIAECVNFPEAKNQLFNVGADQPYTVNELAQMVAEAMGVSAKVMHLEPRNEVKIAFLDHSKAQRVFGTGKQTSLIDGVRRMAEWVKQRGVRQSTIFENIEVTKNMPASWAPAHHKSKAFSAS